MSPPRSRHLVDPVLGAMLDAMPRVPLNATTLAPEYLFPVTDLARRARRDVVAALSRFLNLPAVVN